jgi:hypothetical protein
MLEDLALTYVLLLSGVSYRALCIKLDPLLDSLLESMRQDRAVDEDIAIRVAQSQEQVQEAIENIKHARQAIDQMGNNSKKREFNLQAALRRQHQITEEIREINKLPG